jgi:large subunit ribosomal protein L21e
MPHSFGYRGRTRHLFARKFGENGQIRLSTYLRTFKVGEIVDIAGNGAVQKGLPHKFYHGKTGVIWNVTPRAVGVQVNKLVGNRIIRKKIHVRIEHVKHSTCREDFLKRVKVNDEKKRTAKAAGSKRELHI